MHFIRLRGPWRYEVLERLAGDPSLPSEGKQKLPADWSATLGTDFRGAVSYRRTFHQPTGLEPGQEVWLSIESLTSSAAVTLNGHDLPACPFAAERQDGEPPPPYRHEVHDLLLPTSELTIDVTHPVDAPEPGGLTGLVQLEIQTVRPRPID